MLRVFLFSCLLFHFSCVNKHTRSIHVAIIRGESLNFRVDLDEPAPYESKVAFECLEIERRPVVQFYSRNRALELFKAGQVDVVVSGQAGDYPKEFVPFRRVKEGTKAVILYKSNSKSLSQAVDIPKGVRVGVIENSAFASSFVTRAGDVELKVFRSIVAAISALKENKIDGLIIDQIALEHISPLIPQVKFRLMDLPSKAVAWLYR